MCVHQTSTLKNNLILIATNADNHFNMNFVSYTSSGSDYYMHKVACSYLRTAHYIPEHDQGPPYYVNLAFSIELFLKSLHVSETATFLNKWPFNHITRNFKSIQGHQLDLIFNKLPDDIQNKLSESYREKCDNSFIEDLELIKSTFVDWRYYFEQRNSSVNVTALEKIAVFLKDFTKQQIGNATVSQTISNKRPR